MIYWRKAVWDFPCRFVFVRGNILTDFLQILCGSCCGAAAFPPPLRLGRNTAGIYLSTNSGVYAYQKNWRRIFFRWNVRFGKENPRFGQRREKPASLQGNNRFSEWLGKRFYNGTAFVLEGKGRRKTAGTVWLRLYLTM